MTVFQSKPIVDAIEESIAQHLPDAAAREMYGGMMMELEPDDHSTRLCGYFVHKAHVSVEFSFGAELEDPKGVLEGKGKFRRHLKLREADEVAQKNLQFFLQQLFGR
ncbi:DUF1801 domain-containing protein [uncultured Maritalea sp.]|jgi:hypothetical protein|uniref:DUF1801 domain-containing protein n=1 Tax=uncultured Maritalea sp. TaxID=757249 RepID=UPI002634071A|nr:DUF1801 domain-containing protein [uncultured Maritalea sp.]